MPALIRFFLGFSLVLTSLFLILLVLIQRGRGGGLAGAFGGAGGQSAFGTKAGDVFTKITVAVAGFWILLCILSLNVLGRQSSLFSPSLGGSAPQGTAPVTPPGGPAAPTDMTPATPETKPETAPAATPAPSASAPAGPRSMTGCGEAVVADGANGCRVELRSVNNRFFKLSLRAREGFGVLEGRIEELIRHRIRRGALQMNLDVSGPAAPAARRLDRSQLEAYLDDVADFCATHDLPMPRSLDALLALPGILVDAPPDAAAVERAWPLVARAVAEAVDRLDAMRRAEGESLAAAMRDLLREVTALVATIRARVPGVLADHRAKLVDRVAKLLEQHGTSLTEADIAHEVALIADRSDIAEELVRLESHVAQFDRLLGTESAGRSLDFLSQELAREANTIASKSLDVETAHAVVELKTRIERLREQVQNVE